MIRLKLGKSRFFMPHNKQFLEIIETLKKSLLSGKNII